MNIVELNLLQYQSNLFDVINKYTIRCTHSKNNDLIYKYGKLVFLYIINQTSSQLINSLMTEIIKNQEVINAISKGVYINKSLQNCYINSVMPLILMVPVCEEKSIYDVDNIIESNILNKINLHCQNIANFIKYFYDHVFFCIPKTGSKYFNPKFKNIYMLFLNELKDKNIWDYNYIARYRIENYEYIGSLAKNGMYIKISEVISESDVDAMIYADCFFISCLDDKYKKLFGISYFNLHNRQDFIDFYVGEIDNINLDSRITFQVQKSITDCCYKFNNILEIKISKDDDTLVYKLDFISCHIEKHYFCFYRINKRWHMLSDNKHISFGEDDLFVLNINNEKIKLRGFEIIMYATSISNILSYVI